MNSLPLLSLLVFTPWVGAALLALLRRGSPRTSRLIALAFSLSSLALSVGLLVSFDPTRTSLQFVERQPWITALNVHYHLGLDGLSLVLVLLTSLVTPAALLASWRLERSTRLFSALFLALQGAALGVFLAQDFFHWFIFWELSLVPAFFLIKLWGGAGATRLRLLADEHCSGLRGILGVPQGHAPLNPLREDVDLLLGARGSVRGHELCRGVRLEILVVTVQLDDFKNVADPGHRNETTPCLVQGDGGRCRAQLTAEHPVP